MANGYVSSVSSMHAYGATVAWYRVLRRVMKREKDGLLPCWYLRALVPQCYQQEAAQGIPTEALKGVSQTKDRNWAALCSAHIA